MSEGENKLAKVLIVDDDENLLKALRRSLRNKYDVTIASCSKHAVTLVTENEFAVVVSDYQMPDQTGIEFLMEVKGLSPATTRIMLTGQADMGVALDALNKGNVFRFLEKPSSIDDIEKVIDQAIDEYHTFIETQTFMLFDPLTDCFNRKTIMNNLALEIERSNRYKRPLSIAMLDIDHFKSVNDTYGHMAGDEVLQLVVAAIKKQKRQVDFLGRYGGEEFLLIFPEATLIGALKACEKFRILIEGLSFKNYADLHVTVSLGVAEYQGEPISELIERADSRLYKGKKSGRNTVVPQDLLF